MLRWPTVDPARRAAALAAMRREDVRRAAMATPAERVERLFELMALASLLSPTRHPGSDETIEDWARIRARLRAADASP